jgi:hypothetical protein
MSCPSHLRLLQRTVDFRHRLETWGMFAGFNPADRLLANAGFGGQFGLGPASCFASANDLSGDDDAGGGDRRVPAMLVRRGQRRQVRIPVLKQFRALLELCAQPGILGLQSFALAPIDVHACAGAFGCLCFVAHFC